MLNLNDETTTLLADTLTDVAGGFHETYREYYKGVEVEGAKYTIHYNYEGRPLFANGNFKTIRNLNTIATISESEALQIALNHIGAKKYNWEDTLKESHLKLMMNDSQATYYPYGKFVIYIKNGVSHFTYKYRIDAILPELHLCIYVDASTGEIVDEQNMVCNISNIVSTLYSGSQTIETQLYSDRYRLRDYSRGNGVETYNYNGFSDYYSFNSTWSNMSNYDRAALDAHWGVEKTYDFYYNKFNRNSYDNNGAKLISYVNRNDYPNASWDGLCMTYGSINGNPLVCLDITAHELTHAFTQSTSGLLYQNESGALNEGMSDVFAACVERYVKPANGHNIWQIGEDAFLLRDMSNPTCKYYNGTGWYNTVPNPNLNNDYGGVHTNSGVFNYWFYLLVNGGSGTNEDGIFIQVNGIGFDKAIQICYLMNTSLLTSDATFADAFMTSYLAAQCLGYSEMVLNQICKAWAIVGVVGVENITGANVLCGTMTYTLDELSSGYTVNWSIDNSNFSITPSDYQCDVCYLPSSASYSVANLRAIIIENGDIVAFATKRIVMHDDDLFVDGEQLDEVTPSGVLSGFTFTIPESDRSSSATSWDLQFDDGIEMQTVRDSLKRIKTDSLMISLHPIEPGGPVGPVGPAYPYPYDWDDDPEYGITEINGDAYILLTSDRFDGMNISFSGAHSPVSYSHIGQDVLFRMPPASSIIDNNGEYYVRLRATSQGDCHNFDLYFRVVPIEGEAYGDPEIYLGFNGSNVEVSFFNNDVVLPSGQVQVFPWYLNVYEVITGNRVHASTNYTHYKTVSTSGWNSGIYLVSITCRDDHYTKKFAIQ